MFLLALLILPVPLALAALAVWLDTASRRGYALGALALGAIVLALWGSIAYDHALASSGDNLEGVAYALVYGVGELFLALALTLIAIVETAMARHWWWLGGIVIVSVVSAAVIFTSPATLMPNLLGALGLPRSAFLVVFVLPPVLVAFAYAVARSIRRPLAR